MIRCLFGHAPALWDVDATGAKVWRCPRCWAVRPREHAQAAQARTKVLRTAAERVRARLAREAERPRWPRRKAG